MAVLLNPVPDGAWNRVRQNFGKLGRITLTYHSAVLSAANSEISAVSAQNVLTKSEINAVSAQLVTTDSELQVVSTFASGLSTNTFEASYDADYSVIIFTG